MRSWMSSGLFLAAGFIGCLLLLRSQAVPPLPAEAEGRFERQLPKLFQKLDERRPVHVAFVGDPALLDHGSRHTVVQTFLRQMEHMFFYTGGVFEIYDAKHLVEKRPKITYESLPVDVANPSVFHLMQYVSTLGLLNEPDLLVLCAGPGDASIGLDVATTLRAFDKMHALIKAKAAEMMLLGPRAFVFRDDTVSLQLGTRVHAVAMGQWARENSVPYHDPNPGLFPRSVLFHPGDDAQTVWNAFLRESVDYIQGQLRGPVIEEWRQRAVGMALFQTLTEASRPARYLVESKYGDALTVTLKRKSRGDLGGLIVHSLAGQRQGIRFRPEDAMPTFELQPPPADSGQTYRGRLPFTLIVIDDLRVEWIDVSSAVRPVGVEWAGHALHNNLGTVPLRAKLHPYDGAPDRVPYQISFGRQRTRGEVTFDHHEPAEIQWAVALPEVGDRRIYREKLVLRLGENGSLGTFQRRLDAMRQFPLGTDIPLQWVGPGEEPAPENEDDPLVLGKPKASLHVEASKENLSIHVDLRNFPLVARDDEPCLQLALSLDGRSFEKRQTLGYVGVLFVTAGPEDGPATVSPFAKRAHFGNGYTRRPLVPGRQARLSTRPNGVRRLTVQMTKDYFHRHPWAIDPPNFNSQLGIGLSLSIARPGDASPWYYVLQETPRYPHNAEDLAVVELAEKGSSRWCVKWNP